MDAETNILKEINAALAVIEAAITANGVLIATNGALIVTNTNAIISNAGAIAANAAAIAAAGFVDRGDPTVCDFSTGDLGAAGTWRDLNLSSIIPEGTKLVLLRVRINSTTAGKSLHIRTKDNTGGINVSLTATQVAGLTMGVNFWVAPNADGVVEYYFSTATWTTRDFTVGGWFV